MTFKNSKTKKSTTKPFRCVVKAEKKVDESYKIASASATGVQTITVELNKAVADATKVKAAVKKGTAARASSFTVDGSKIIIKTEAKLTAGAYTVTVEGLETTALTADLTVEKDETLTSYEISDYIASAKIQPVTDGIIKYAALNQYGEKMLADAPDASCSFGTVLGGRASVTATATKEGEIYVQNINPVLAIVGTKGTVVLVDRKSGVTATKEISFNTAATPATLEMEGMYHVNTATIKDIAEGDRIDEYELLFSAKDQYGYSMDSDDFNNTSNDGHGVNASMAGGLTNMKLKGNAGDNWNTRTIKGVDYITLALEADPGKTYAVAGDATLTVVNPVKGLLLTTAVTVAKNVVIKSFNVTAENGVYADQDNELTYEAIDADGKSVTNYAVLMQVVDLSQTRGEMKFVKNTDGTAKLVYHPGSTPLDTSDNENQIIGKASTIETETVYANQPTSGDYMVKPLSFTVYQKRVVKSVTGIEADTVTSISKDTESLKIDSKKLVFADQYSNKVANTETIFKDALKVAENSITGKGTAVKIVDNNHLFSGWSITGTAITVTAAAFTKPGTATVYVKYNPINGKTVNVTTANADAKFTISVYDTRVAADVEIESINGGYAMKATSGQAVRIDDLSKIKVVGTAGGSKTVIPTTQYVVTKYENNTITADEAKNPSASKTAKVTIQVTTKDSYGNEVLTELSKEFTISIAADKVYKVTGTSAGAITVTTGTAVTASALQDCFKFVDQYNSQNGTGVKVDAILGANGVARNVRYTARLKEVKVGTADGFDVPKGNTQNDIEIKFSAAGTYVVTITAVSEDGSSQSVDITFKVN